MILKHMLPQTNVKLFFHVTAYKARENNKYYLKKKKRGGGAGFLLQWKPRAIPTRAPREAYSIFLPMRGAGDEFSSSRRDRQLRGTAASSTPFQPSQGRGHALGADPARAELTPAAPAAAPPPRTDPGAGAPQPPARGSAHLPSSRPGLRL